MADPNEIIEQNRLIINETDTKIVELLNKRMTAVVEIGKAKKELGLPVTDIKREADLKKRLSDKEQRPGMVEAVWSAIINFSKTLE